MGMLEGKTALVTGGSSGIGKATVKRFLDGGAQVAVVDLQPPTDDVAFIEADVGLSASWPVIAEQAVQHLGAIDIAFLNAGVTTGESEVARVTDAQYDRIMRVNLHQVFYGIREMVPLMSQRGGGWIVATASLAGLTGVPPDPVYAATKHAVVGLVRSLGPVLEQSGIRINAVCPGFTDTPLLGGEAGRALREMDFPLLDAEDIAKAVVTAIESGGTGLCYPVQPGREAEPYRFAGIPGPKLAGTEGTPRPPFLR
ncbi:MAG: SDR family NAD(P)-dependent oxidoreductase [Candidatus Dormibacteria bacterium]